MHISMHTTIIMMMIMIMIIIIITFKGSREMDRQLRTLAALPQDTSST
jgi:ABC-type nitrate/sulfonate/bicarbonate transport system permease component